MLALLLGYLAGLNHCLSNPFTVTASQPAHGARVFCPQPTVDLGSVEAGQLVRPEFPITNLTDQTVWVKPIRGFAGLETCPIFPISPRSTRMIAVCLQFNSGSGAFHMSFSLFVVDPPGEPTCSLCGWLIANHPHAASGSSCECSTPTTQPAPEVLIACSKPVADFGTGMAGSRIRVEYPVTNLTNHTCWVRPRTGFASIEPPLDFPIPAKSTRPVPICHQFSRGVNGSIYRKISLIVIDPSQAPTCSLCGFPVAAHPHGPTSSGCQCGAATTQPVTSR